MQPQLLGSGFLTTKFGQIRQIDVVKTANHKRRNKFGDEVINHYAPQFTHLGIFIDGNYRVVKQNSVFSTYEEAKKSFSKFQKIRK